MGNSEPIREHHRERHPRRLVLERLVPRSNRSARNSAVQRTRTATWTSAGDRAIVNVNGDPSKGSDGGRYAGMEPLASSAQRALRRGGAAYNVVGYVAVDPTADIRSRPQRVH